MAKPLLLVDFDRTLFDTASFVDWLWSVMEREYHVDGEAEKARARDFYTYSGDWYDYVFFDHLQAIPQLSRDDFDNFSKRMHALADRPTFLFPDATGVLDDCDEIVTFGNEPYQRFKLGFCPELASIPTRIIQIGKAEYIAANYQGSVILIDDKHLEDELPDWVSFILIDRTQEDPILQHRGNFFSVNSLHEVKSLSEVVV